MSGLSYSEQLRTIVSLYQAAGQPWPAPAVDIAAWAIHQGHWKPHPKDIVRQLSEQISTAMREEYFVDAQGRKVRAKHAARRTINGEQQMLWADIRTAEPKHMEIAFQQRRQQIVGDCRQLKADVDSYNENTNPGGPIQMVFDFTQDLAELEALDNFAA